MLRKNPILGWLLMCAVSLSSFSFVIRAQDLIVNDEKTKVRSLPPPEPQELKSDDSFSDKINDELVPSAVFTANPNAPIPDNAYNGNIASTACSTINTTSVIPAGNAPVSEVYLDVNLTHTWVGDLTIKLISPSGTTLTVLNRPGSAAPDDGSDSPVGNNSNWNGSVQFRDGAATAADAMGNTLSDSQLICTNDGRCAYSPSPDTATTPPTNFTALNDENARGTWTLCVGDSALLDTGTLRSWTLNLTYAAVVTAAPNLSIPDDAYAGGFGGVGQRCSTINTSGILPAGTINQGVYIDVNLLHTWVGDLTIKLRSPNNTTLTILNRPGSTAPDDGTGAVGDNTDWNGSLQFRDGSPTGAELMGSTLENTQVVCANDGLCRYFPAPDTATTPPTNFAAFNGSTAVGNWTLCVGDSALGDVGTLRSWAIKFPNTLAPSAASVRVAGRVLTASGLSVGKARVSLVNSDGQARTFLSNQFGYYYFDGIPVGETYTVTAQAKGLSFTPQLISVSDEISGLDIIAFDQ